LACWGGAPEPGSDESRQNPPQTGIDRIFSERQALEQTLEVQSKFWREEVVNRVEGYRTRRARKRLAGQFSMRLDFEPQSAQAAVPEGPVCPSADFGLPTPGQATEGGSAQAGYPSGLAERASTAPAASAGPEAELPGPQQAKTRLAGDPGQPLEVEALPSSDTAAGPQSGQAGRYMEDGPETNVVEFPRFVLFPEFEPDPRALAEPVFDRPRILEVPEGVGAPTAPRLADVALLPAGEEEEDEAVLAPELELPLRVAPFSLRFTAALIDLLAVSIASGLFAIILASSSLGLAPGKPLLALEFATPVFFWAVYYDLFLVHAAATPGMIVAGVRLLTFRNEKVPRSLRRWRALAMVLSLVSLGFGFLWALLDQDNLCWHDKMTGTYLTAG
jgi:uncharacterized RDD family membrane protein YckC